MTENTTSFGPNTTLRPIYSAVVQYAVLLTTLLGGALILCLALSLHDFSYYWGWASGHFATIARTFSQHGIFALGGTPIENNDPITAEPDTYTHFPPLYFYALSSVIDMSHASMRAMHLFMAAIVLATAVVVWRLCRYFLNPEASVFAAAAYLLMPTTLRYGLTLLPVNLALLELALALLFLLRHARRCEVVGSGHDLAISVFAFFLACFTSWEVYLAVPGIALAIALGRRRELLPALAIWTVAAAAAVGVTFFLYIRSDPQFAHDLWSIAAFRAGLSDYTPPPTRLHPIEGGRPVEGERAAHYAYLSSLLSPSGIFSVYISRPVRFLGVPGMVGAIVFFAALVGSRSRQERQVIPRHALLPFATVWLGWAILMREHYAGQDYQMVLSTPVAAIGLAIAYSHIERGTARADHDPMRSGGPTLLKLALFGAMLVSGADAAWITYQGNPVEQHEVAFGRAIKEAVAPGSIVLTDDPNMVPVYYSERHVIRGMQNGTELQQQLSAIHNLCRSCPLYLAIAPGSAEKFRDVLGLDAPILSNETAVIAKLPEAAP